ncbi:hypothetical protein TcasGA2_TC032707 [Tribolium castaneum]|uniref:Uncharacterized protein n=1 Tax=Tribolium castaneum TaxID=7070 RepID=A0A139W906_TRICA|nr:hypothetical protein TcasGA2_TC032707 [Tribolium castaneum]
MIGGDCGANERVCVCDVCEIIGHNDVVYDRCANVIDECGKLISKTTKRKSVERACEVSAVCV